MQRNKICPYPGLRPFNEEESIFFRGREEHIEKIITQLEEKKFLMLTGASGDGKSSIVYAGVIPNARAGFFKAKFNNWIIADFRPERSPLKNIAMALAAKLGYNNIAAVEKELGYGFSSLINLYKNSPYNIDYNSETWKNANDTEKKILKRKGANLFILVDQFEEFFTNIENYNNGKASNDSQVVVNLLLETAKIALAEDLPIYIICTMRSDYIGQCAAFRGLPEYIGFSQFFVPRLKRKEIHQVIEEPATLNGDKITNRLTETLINEIGEGYDQLPVLQHALNQIWNQVKENEPMDLIHLAKINGLNKLYLPKEQIAEFDSWFNSLPDFKKSLFNNPSLEKVLNAHANELYERADEYYFDSSQKPISKEEAKLIIKSTFQCLTRIDASRAVRNRMTLDEITHIINNPEITPGIVGRVIDVFRLQGNTFIKPFMIGEGSVQTLEETTVLDITHESLIRNWSLLEEWAKEENENWLNFQDFNKQLERWLKSGKSKGYLLPIGPLTFFENWYNKCKPNKYWLVRYDERDNTTDAKLSEAEDTLINAKEFIKRSARSLFISRTIIKYGANRLIAYFASLVFICICTYFYLDYRKKQNSNVLREIKKQGMVLLSSNRITITAKSDFVINYERLHPNSFAKVLDSLQNDTTAYDIAMKMFTSCENIDDRDKVIENPLQFPLVNYLDSKLDRIHSYPNTKGNDNYFKRFGEFIRLCGFIKSYEPKNNEINKLINKYIEIVYIDYINYKLNKPSDSLNFEPIVFNNALELVLCYSEHRAELANDILMNLSPFENPSGLKRFNKLYLLKGSIKEGWNKIFTHNAGYQELGYLYATSGNIEKVKICLDSIIKYNPDYKQYYNVDFSILALFILTNNAFKKDTINTLLNKYESYSGYTHLKLIQMLINVIINKPYTYLIKNSSNHPYSSYIKICAASAINKIYDYYLEEIEHVIKDKNELNFKLATFYKEKGLDAEYTDSVARENCFSKAFEYYSQLPTEYLSGNTVLGLTEGPESKKIHRSSFFLYPYSINEFNQYNPFQIWESPKSFYFLDYIIKNNLISLFRDKEDYDTFEKFLYNYVSVNAYNRGEMRDSINSLYCEFGQKLLKNNQLGKENIDSNQIFLIYTLKYLRLNDTLNANRYYKKVDTKIIKSFGFQNETNDDANSNTTLLETIAENFAIIGYKNEAFKIMSWLNEAFRRRNLLISIAYKLQENGPVEDCFIYLDSLFHDVNKNHRYGLRLLKLNGMIGSSPINELSVELIRELSDADKPEATVNLIKGIAYNGLYFKALTYMPQYVSQNDKLKIYNQILDAENRRRLLPDKFMNAKDPFLNYDNKNFSKYEQFGSKDFENGNTGSMVYYSNEE